MDLGYQVHRKWQPFDLKPNSEHMIEQMVRKFLVGRHVNQRGFRVEFGTIQIKIIHMTIQKVRFQIP